MVLSILTICAVFALILICLATADELTICVVTGPDLTDADCRGLHGISRVFLKSIAIKDAAGAIQQPPKDFVATFPSYILEGWNGPNSWAIWSNQWLVDQDGNWRPCRVDWETILDEMDTGKFSIRHRAELAAISGDWNKEFLLIADGGAIPNVTATIEKIQGSELWMRVTSDSINPVVLIQPALDVLLDGVWYRLPRDYAPNMGEPTAASVQKGMQFTPVVNIDLICARYDYLPAGRYRIWAYGATYEFDLD